MRLEDINKESPFKVPEGYFDNFNSMMKNRISEDIKKERKIKTVMFYLKRTVTIAAIFVFSLIITQPDNYTPTKISYEEYVMEYFMTELDESYLYDAYVDAGLE